MTNYKTLLNRAIELQKQINELSEEYNDIKAKVKLHMIESKLSKIETSKAKAIIKSFERDSFDMANFKKRCPKMYIRFAYTIKQESIVLKQKKEK